MNIWKNLLLLQENVAIVEFNASARIVQCLSTDYSRCRRAVGEQYLSTFNTGTLTSMFFLHSYVMGLSLKVIAIAIHSSYKNTEALYE